MDNQKNDTSQATENFPILEKAFNEFGNNYRPTNSTQKELKSTHEIQTLFNELTGMKTSLFEISEGLEKMGYQFKLIENEFLWMVEKTDGTI